MQRLLYLILQDEKLFYSLVSKIFESREKKLINETFEILEISKIILSKNEKNLSKKILNCFSYSKLRGGLKLVQTLSKKIETYIRNTKGFDNEIKPKSFEQIW